MSTDSKRYSRLAPLSIDQRINLSLLAATFFSPLKYKEMCAVIGKTPEPRIRPFDDMDFFMFLEKSSLMPDADRYRHRINELLGTLSTANVLTKLGPGRNAIGGGSYYFVRELTSRQKEGYFWLTPALGSEYLHRCLGPVTLQITGTNGVGDDCAGTGLAISPHWILTCSHVLTEMSLDSTQDFNGKQYQVTSALSDMEADVGLIRVDTPLPQAPGLGFRDPVIGEPIMTLGYPRIPLSRNPALIMHRGEVTTEVLQTLAGQMLFLYSAIARPGNSGGPVVANDGSVIGIVSDELGEGGPSNTIPFYAGVRASDIASAIVRLTAEVALPMEDYN